MNPEMEVMCEITVSPFQAYNIIRVLYIQIVALRKEVEKLQLKEGFMNVFKNMSNKEGKGSIS